MVFITRSFVNRETTLYDTKIYYDSIFVLWISLIILKMSFISSLGDDGFNLSPTQII